MKIIIDTELPNACHYVNIILECYFDERERITHNSITLFKDNTIVISKITKSGYSFRVLKK